MLFDREALSGIYNALSEWDRSIVEEHCGNHGIMENAYDDEKRLGIIYNALIALGHIIPPPPPLPTEEGAAEYEEAMNALALMGD